MLKHFFLLTLKGIRHRPIRGWLTILGIVIGIMLVVIILALSSGIQSAVSQQITQFGSNLIIIFPGKETNPFAGLLGNQKFKEQDIRDLTHIDGVKFSVPAEAEAFNVEHQGETKSVMVQAAPWKEMIEVFDASQGVKLLEGRWPRDDSVNEIIVGYLTASILFQNPIRVGDVITVKSKRMTVVGILSEIGNQQDDNAIDVSLELFQNISGARGSVRSAMLKVEDGADVDLVAKQVRYQLSKQNEVEDFAVLTPDKASRIVGSVLQVVELVLIIIALISLVVGAVGIMNTMYTSVLERTKQIGVMKAIGANSDAILTLFLIESGMIGLVGGVIGIVFGVFVAYLIGVISESLGVGGLFSFAALDFFGLLVILVITFITGIVSGLLPARSAAKMEPAQALRYE